MLWPGCHGPNIFLAGLHLPRLTHQQTGDEKLLAVSCSSVAQTAPFPPQGLGFRLHWQELKVTLRPGPGTMPGHSQPLVEGHLIKLSVPWLPPALDRGHWQLDVTLGTPLILHLL